MEAQHPRWTVVCLALALSLLTGCAKSGQPPASIEPSSGVRGRVLLVWEGPVTQTPQPVKHVEVDARSNGPRGSIVASTTTDSNGSFKLDLPPGTYTLTGELSTSSSVTVAPGEYSPVTLGVRVSFAPGSKRRE